MTYIQVLLSDICARVVKLLLAGKLLKKSQAGAGRGKIIHFEPVFNAVVCRMRVFQQLVSIGEVIAIRKVEYL